MPPAELADAEDRQAASRYADALVEAATARLAGASDNDAAGYALVEELGNIRQALQAGNVQALRRQSGFLGRLLGRDLEAEARAQVLQQQLGVVMLRAEQHAKVFRETLERREAVCRDGIDAADALGCWVAFAEERRTSGAWARRLDHLQRLAASWRLEAEHWRLLAEQGRELIDRYQRIRDVLLPAWRQSVLADRAARNPAQLAEARHAQAGIAVEVDAMQARLRR